MRIKKIVAMLLCASVFFTGAGVTNCVGYAVENAESPEKDMKANSWRFSDGQPIEQGRSVQMYSAESDSSNAWRKVNGRYVNSKGEVIPGAEKKGIDVSEWNEKINWEEAIADGVEYAIIRCGWGMDYTDQDDDWWEYNVSECERLGIPYGVYLYSYATNTDRASSEADHALRLLQGHHPSYPVYFDMEDSSTQDVGNAMLGSIAKTFCDKVSAAGYRVGIYASLNWWNTYLTDPVFNNGAWSKWVAQWSDACTYTGAYDMWQCTEKGSVQGINGNVDLNFWMVKSSDAEPVDVADPYVIRYSSHMQSFGWGEEVNNGCQTGVTGYAKRMEAFKINVGEGYGDLGVEYQAYVNGDGWQQPVSNGEVAGTIGEAKAIGAVKISLTGSESEKYDIYYRTHCQTYGWLGWAKNGEAAGNQGYDKRMEALQIAVVEKGAQAPGSTEDAFRKMPTSVIYRSCVQGTGWQNPVADGAESGSTGQAKSLEGICVKIENTDCEGGVAYDVYMQSYGWLGEKSDYAENGIPQGNKRMEAMKIYLTGELAEYYDIYYRTHVQGFGWLDWAKNGEIAGTLDYAKRIEAIQIQLVEKGSAAPGNTGTSYKKAVIACSAHVQTLGWSSTVHDSETVGTTGLAKRLEAIKIAAVDKKLNSNIRFRVHVQTYGWQNWREGGEIAGTTGEAKRLEAVQIELTGELAEQYDIYYRTHCQSYGWLGWAKNGELAGTEGLSKRMEAMQIVLVEKGGIAPGETKGAFVK